MTHTDEWTVVIFEFFICLDFNLREADLEFPETHLSFLPRNERKRFTQRPLKNTFVRVLTCICIYTVYPYIQI